MATQQPPNRDTVVTTLTWILANPLASLTILGAVSYLVFRVAFLIYYERFGVTPEEVGLDYSGILITQAAGGLLEILFVVGIALVARIRLAHIQTEYADIEAYNSEIRKLSRQTTRWLIGIPIIFLALVLGDALQAGVEARSPFITEPFQGRAIGVVALWIDPPGEDSKPRPITYSDLGASNSEPSTPAFLLLGNNGGTMVLYDRHLGAVRLPRDQVMLVSSQVPKTERGAGDPN